MYSSPTGASSLFMLYRNDVSVDSMEYYEDEQFYTPQRFTVNNDLGDLYDLAGTSVTYKIGVADVENSDSDIFFGYAMKFKHIDSTYLGNTVA